MWFFWLLVIITNVNKLNWYIECRYYIFGEFKLLKAVGIHLTTIKSKCYGGDILIVMKYYVIINNVINRFLKSLIFVTLCYAYDIIIYKIIFNYI